jgi:hypothetical protein
MYPPLWWCNAGRGGGATKYPVNAEFVEYGVRHHLILDLNLKYNVEAV